MTGKTHTPGTIRYEWEPGYCGELVTSRGTTIARFTDEPSKEDARRLVACWNACKDVPTEVLEAQQAGGLPWAVADQIEALVQRGELLAVLRNFEIQGPDDDGLVWLVLHGNDTSGKGMFNLGEPTEIATQVALELEKDRLAAINKINQQEK